MNILLAAVVVTLVVNVLAYDHEHEDHPTKKELAAGMSHLYRAFLKFDDPEHVALQDALDVHWRYGMVRSDPIKSTVKAVFAGEEQNAFSSIYTIINRDQKGLTGDGTWCKHEPEVLISYHYGAPVLVHLLTESGAHTETVLGNPLQTNGARFSLLMPHSTYGTVESLSRKTFTFISLTSIPAWSEDSFVHLDAEEMVTKFPALEELIRNVSNLNRKPYHKNYDDHDSHHHHGDHDHHHHHDSHDDHHNDDYDKHYHHHDEHENHHHHHNDQDNHHHHDYHDNHHHHNEHDNHHHHNDHENHHHSDHHKHHRGHDDRHHYHDHDSHHHHRHH